MPDVKKCTILLFLFMIFITPLSYATDLSGELAALREELEIIDYVLSDSSLILLDSETQAVLYLGKVINIHALITAITQHVALNNKDGSRPLPFGLEDILKNSNGIKKQLKNYRIPEIDNRIAEISRQNIRQATKTHPENDYCGGVMIQAYLESIKNSWLLPELKRWSTLTWTGHSWQMGHGLVNFTKYDQNEANFRLWQKRVNCMGVCYGQGFEYEIDIAKCVQNCKENTKYLDCSHMN